MLDNQLISLIISTLIAGEAAAGISGTPIKQAFQPTQQGVNSAPTAYLHKIADRRLGFVKRKDTWDAEAEIMEHSETQQYETLFQLSALARQDPSIIDGYTASDILNLMAYILQSSVAVSTLEAQDVGIYRIGDVRNPYFSDDKQRNEASPTLDFTVTHKQVIINQTPIISRIIIQVLTV